MSPKNPLLTVGLTALGFLGLAATRAASPADPPATAGQPSPAPSPSPISNTVLLLSDGRVIRGRISQAGGVFRVRQVGLGELKFKAAEVAGTFPTVADAYRHRTSLVPDGDPDEHLKLAKWCMTQKMPAEAKEQLLAVLKVSPDARQAKMMLESLEAAEFRTPNAKPRLDDGLVRTGAEVSDAPGAGGRGPDEPSEIDVAVLQRARKTLGTSNVPTIFDLSPSAALARSQIFMATVQPVLLRDCYRCHNEKHPGAFQLIDVKGRRDLAADAMRLNLEATLRFINPDDPSKSDLLSATILPHGKGPNKAPVFRGASDWRFKALADWARSLRSTPAPNLPSSASASRFGGAEAAGSGGFATERRGDVGVAEASESAVATTPAFSDDVLARHANPLGTPSASVMDPVRFDGRAKPFDPKRIGTRGVVEAGPASDAEFPRPLMFRDGPAAPMPALPDALPALPNAAPGAPPKAAAAPPGPLPPGYTELPPEATDAIPGRESAEAKARKPVKVDPALLQRALGNRNGNP